jgi:rhamnogalacturonan endolyase
MLSRGGAYWNVYGSESGEKPTQNKGHPATYTVTKDPAKNGGAVGEIVLGFPYRGEADVEPLDLEIRYTLSRGDSGIYGSETLVHKAGYPAFNDGVNTVCWKLNPDVFDFLSAGDEKQRHMVTPEDWVKGTQLNLWEARRMNTGIRKGEVEHKYDYSVLFAKTPAWGWSSTTQKVGMFIVNPSIEYLNGPATMTDYVGHIDVKASLPADPTLLFIWQSPHYGGRGSSIGADEQWQKTVGPFLIYCNTGDTPQAMWQDAKARAAQEKKAWPYAWADIPGFEHAQERGSASGVLSINDPLAPQGTQPSAAGAWVGLAQPPYQAPLGNKGSMTTIDWQLDGKHYQYWVQADAAGRFTIPNARPGTYTLYAFVDGVLGTFSHEGVKVEAGRTTDVGALTWTPQRYGQQLWDIGIPDRTAAEFRHGNEYWQWGLYNHYPTEFPNDVDFVIGKSDWHKDWNYCQPPRPAGNGKWQDTTWRIRFNMDHVPKGTGILRLAICGARGGPVDATLNGQSIGSTGELPESGVMHRDGIRSDALIEVNLKFDASLFKQGENIITLTKHVRAWTDGVLYDYVRLELDEAK